MRQERIIQATIFEVFAEHEIGRELKAISQWLDEHRGLLSLVAGDLRRHGIQETGRHGLPAEAVVRCALLKQYRQLSYEELAFHLEDSASFRAFARLPLSWSPSKSVLHKTISRLADYLRAHVKPNDLAIDDCQLAAAQFIQMCQASLFLPFVFQAAPAPPLERIDEVVDSATRMFLAAYRAKAA